VYKYLQAKRLAEIRRTQMFFCRRVSWNTTCTHWQLSHWSAVTKDVKGHWHCTGCRCWPSPGRSETATTLHLPATTGNTRRAVICQNSITGQSGDLTVSRMDGPTRDCDRGIHPYLRACAMTNFRGEYF